MSKISKSSIDWKKLLELVPPEQKASYFAFKAKNDAYLRRVAANPAQAPTIDWEMYKKIVPTPELVDKLKTRYESIQVPYPDDKYSAEVNAQWVSLEPEIKRYCDEMETVITNCMKDLERIKSLPSFEVMTLEMFADMFPDVAMDFVKKPSFWPHGPDEQLGYKEPKPTK